MKHAAMRLQGLRLSRRPSTEATARALHPWRWAWTGVLLGLLLVGLIQAPAAWLARGLAWASNQRVLLTEPQGTVWQGHARLVFSGGSGSRDATALPSRLHWSIRPRWLGADIALHSDCCTAPGHALLAHIRAQWGGARIAVSNTTLQLPSALLSGLGTPWNTLQPQGQLSLHTHDLHVHIAQSRAAVQGYMQIVLHNASTRLSTVQPLGSYEVRIQGGATAESGQPLEITLSSQPGSSLILQGQGNITAGHLYFRGEATATTERAEALDNLLHIIGRRVGERSILSFG